MNVLGQGSAPGLPDRKDPYVVRSFDPSIDLRQLRYFIAAVEHGSIAAAAAALGQAAATLSEGIARLEARVGTRLAIRGQRGLTLTEAGSLLVSRGMALLEEEHALALAVRGAGYCAGAVALALPPSLSVLIGVPLAETIRSELPDVRLRVSEGLSGDIMDWIEKEQSDSGFVYDAADRSQFDFVEVFQEELFVAAAADFMPFGLRAGDEATIPLERVSELPLVMPSMKHNARKVAERIARASQISLNVVSELDSYSQIVETVDRASAYSLMSRAAALAPVERGSIVLIPIDSRPFRRSCYHIRKRQRPVTSASLAVEAKAVAIIREMNDRFALNLHFA